MKQKSQLVHSNKVSIYPTLNYYSFDAINPMLCWLIAIQQMDYELEISKYAVIVDEGEARISYQPIDIESE